MNNKQKKKQQNVVILNTKALHICLTVWVDSFVYAICNALGECYCEYVGYSGSMNNLRVENVSVTLI